MGSQWVGVTHMRSLCVDVEAGLASDGHLADSGARDGHLGGIHDGAAEGRACRGPEVQVRYRSDTGQIQVITAQLKGELPGARGAGQIQVRYRSDTGHNGAAEGRACRGPEVQVRYRSDTGHNGAAERRACRVARGAGQIQVKCGSDTGQTHVRHTCQTQVRVRHGSDTGQGQTRVRQVRHLSHLSGAGQVR